MDSIRHWIESHTPRALTGKLARLAIPTIKIEETKEDVDTQTISFHQSHHVFHPTTFNTRQ
jgi:hypothetical protein